MNWNPLFSGLKRSGIWLGEWVIWLNEWVIGWLLRFALFAAYVLVMIVLYRTTLGLAAPDYLFWPDIAHAMLDSSSSISGSGGALAAASAASNSPSQNRSATGTKAPEPAATSSLPPPHLAHEGSGVLPASEGVTSWKWVVGFALELIPRSLEALKNIGPDRSIALVFFVLSGAPYLLTFWSSFLLARRQKRLDDTKLVLPLSAADGANPEWKQISDCVLEQWDFAKAQRKLTYDRARDYAHLYGFIATATLAGCLIVLLHAPGLGMNPLLAGSRVPYHVMIPIAVGVAAAVSFTLEFGKIMVRLASNDASARMYAAGLRTLLAAIVSAFFLPLVLTIAGEDKFANLAMGVAVLGAAVGLLGRRILDVVVSQADNVLNVKNVTTQDRIDLTVIDGINDDDVDRLAEEGVDSVEALAYALTAQLYFNTVYGLARICDWQDQALLLDFLGSRAQSWRENLGIQSAVAAQLLAGSMLWKDGQVPKDPDAPLVKILSEDDHKAIYKGLGFATDQAADLKLRELLNAYPIKLLRLYRMAGVHSDPSPDANAVPNRAKLGGGGAADQHAV